MYIVGADIHDDRDFYGREDLIESLTNGSEHHVFLMGFRRTGKTATLLAMERRALAGDSQLPLMVVLQGQRSLDEVRDDLATALRRKARVIPGLDVPPLMELRSYPLDVLMQVAVDVAASAGRGVLLLLDEADTLLRLARQSPTALARFRSTLPRGASDAVVLTGTRTALQLADADTAAPGEEPFLTGFARKLLAPTLVDDAARSLVLLEKRDGQGAVRLRTDAITDLIRRTGGHPFLLQHTCDHLRTHGGDVARAVSSVVALRASTEAFQADLQRISPSEREVLTAILRGEAVPPALDVFQRSLVELGVLDSNGWFRVPALADYLRQTGWRTLTSLLNDAQAVPGSAAPRPVEQGQRELVPSGGSLRYRLVRKLGGGGFSEVFLVRLMDTDGFERLAALKVLLGRWEQHEDLAARIRDEGRLLGRLRHKAIVRVDFPVRIDGQFGLVMEYVAGVDVYDVIAAKNEIGGIPARVVADVIAEVATALDVALNRVPEEGNQPLRVLHRDIKPGNIRLTRDGEVKVLDFGIARGEFASREANTGHDGLGTPGYYAPERQAGHHDNPASDVYALGRVLVELLLGFQSPPPLHDRRVHEASVADILGRIPQEITAFIPLIRDMLAWDPEDRPTAAEISRRARFLPAPGTNLLDWTNRVLPQLLEARTLPPTAAVGMTNAPSTLAPAGALFSLKDAR